MQTFTVIDANGASVSARALSTSSSNACTSNVPTPSPSAPETPATRRDGKGPRPSARVADDRVEGDGAVQTVSGAAVESRYRNARSRSSTRRVKTGAPVVPRCRRDRPGQAPRRRGTRTRPRGCRATPRSGGGLVRGRTPRTRDSRREKGRHRPPRKGRPVGRAARPRVGARGSGSATTGAPLPAPPRDFAAPRESEEREDHEEDREMHRLLQPGDGAAGAGNGDPQLAEDVAGRRAHRIAEVVVVALRDEAPAPDRDDPVEDAGARLVRPRRARRRRRHTSRASARARGRPARDGAPSSSRSRRRTPSGLRAARARGATSRTRAARRRRGGR